MVTHNDLSYLKFKFTRVCSRTNLHFTRQPSFLEAEQLIFTVWCHVFLNSLPGFSFYQNHRDCSTIETALHVLNKVWNPAFGGKCSPLHWTHLGCASLGCTVLQQFALSCIALCLNILHCRRSAVTACPRFMDNSRQGSRFHGAPNPIFLTITCRLIHSKVDFSSDFHLAEADFLRQVRFGSPWW